MACIVSSLVITNQILLVSVEVIIIARVRNLRYNLECYCCYCRASQLASWIPVGSRGYVESCVQRRMLIVSEPADDGLESSIRLPTTSGLAVVA